MATIDHVVAKVYHNHGRWVADCPRPFCASAERYGVDPITQKPGGLDMTDFHCDECGLHVPAQWPRLWRAIEFVLSFRPVPATRNFNLGERYRDLVKENMGHGLDWKRG